VSEGTGRLLGLGSATNTMGTDSDDRRGCFCHILWTEFGERGKWKLVGCGHSVTVKGKVRHDKDADPTEILGDVWRLSEKW
jgi:hypothetical protein